MALTHRREHREEEEESVFVSMTDLMISILFIVMIVMAFFAKSASKNTPQISELQRQIVTLRNENKRLDAENRQLKIEIERLRNALEILRKPEADPLETALKGISQDRALLLKKIEERLIAAGIEVIVDEVSGVVHLGEDAIQFDINSFNPDRESSAAMGKIAEILMDEVPCFTLGKRSAIADGCNPNGSIIEAIQIEGHTDVDGTPLYNLELSTRRATATYRVMVTHRPGLESFLNANYLLDEKIEVDAPGQQVLSVSGYGETRPVAYGDTSTAKRANRRIDIRFIMTTPKNVAEIETLRLAVRRGLRGQGDAR